MAKRQTKPPPEIRVGQVYLLTGVASDGLPLWRITATTDATVKLQRITNASSSAVTEALRQVFERAVRTGIWQLVEWGGNQDD